MEIELKHNVGDEVYYLDYFNMKIERGKIENIEVVIFESTTVVWYSVKQVLNEEEPDNLFEMLKRNFNNTAVRLREDMMFKNREEILDFAIKITEEV